MRLLAEGHYKKTAADALGISFHTVSFHLKNIHGKLQCHSKTEAVANAWREKLFSPYCQESPRPAHVSSYLRVGFLLKGK